MNWKVFTPVRREVVCISEHQDGARQDIPLRPREPRWPALLALLAIGGLCYALPYSLTVGPHWLVLILIALLTTPALSFNGDASWRTSLICGYAANALVTCSTIASLLLLVLHLPEHKESPPELLISAGVLGLQYSRLCLLVLEVGCRWPAPARSPKLPFLRSVSLPADRAESAVAP